VNTVARRERHFQVLPYDHHGPRLVHGFDAGIEVIIDLLDDRAVALSDRIDAIAPVRDKMFRSPHTWGPLDVP
jgi:hypothetical protein